MVSQAATRKLYLENSYQVSFNATVLSCARLGDGRMAAILDETCFYPESGGQLADTGAIGEARVTDVWEDEGEVVYHAVDRGIQPGNVSCAADWDRRFDHMQQHTGQHVLSRAFIETAGLQTVSFHMGPDACTIDLDGTPTGDDLDEAERLANAVVLENRPVHIRTMKPEAIEEAALRKKLPEGISTVRLVEIENFDVIGCCGTHVRATGELGAIKILKHEKAKGAQRITFKVGWRALADYREKHTIVKELANRLTTAPAELVEKIEKDQAESRATRKSMQRLSKSLAAYEARTLAEGAVGQGTTRVVARALETDDDDYLRALSAELKSRAGVISVLGASTGTVVCNAHPDTAVDFAAVVARAKDLGGSGGGKGAFASIRLPADASVAAFIDEVVEMIRDQ